MPKIKAYRGAGKIIPVDVAKLGTAYRCPWTGAVMGDKRSYVAHLKALRRDRMHRNIYKKRMDAIRQELWNQSDFDAVIRWINLHTEFVFNEFQETAWTSPSRSKKSEPFTFEITYLHLTWGPSISNSHSAPRGGVTNSSDPTRPRGYPGWDGTIEYKVTGDRHLFGDLNRALAALGIHTGTGGGRGNGYHGYGVKFFAADWPGLSTDVSHAHTMAIIQGTKFKHSFEYGSENYFKPFKRSSW